MYNSLNDSDGNNKSMASCTSQDSIVTVIEVKNQPKAGNEGDSISQIGSLILPSSLSVSNLPESAMYIKPGPASKKKLLLNRHAAELAAAQGKIINLSPIEIENTPPEELVTPSVKPKDPPKIIEVVTIPKEATLNVPQDGLPVEPSTSLPTFDLVDYQLKKRGLKVKPGPKRMKQKVLEKAKKLEDPDNFLNIRPCPGSKKRKYLQELFDSQPAFLKKFKDTGKSFGDIYFPKLIRNSVLAPEKPIAQPVLPPREVAPPQMPRELTEPTDFAPVPARPPPVFDLESIEAHKNAKRGTKCEFKWDIQQYSILYLRFSPFQCGSCCTEYMTRRRVSSSNHPRWTWRARKSHYPPWRAAPNGSLKFSRTWKKKWTHLLGHQAHTDWCLIARWISFRNRPT